jgi:hypothetical protein
LAKPLIVWPWGDRDILANLAFQDGLTVSTLGGHPLKLSIPCRYTPVQIYRFLFATLSNAAPGLGRATWRTSCFEAAREPGSCSFGKTSAPRADGDRMLTALILICSLTSVSDVGACTEDNALEVLRSPETFASPVACLMHGQAYLANTAIGRDLENNETVKVV